MTVRSWRLTTTGLALLIRAAAVSACGFRDEGTPIVLEQLIEDSKRHITAMESTTLNNHRLSAEEAQALAAYAAAHPDDTAYHALLALRRSAAPQYQQLAATVKASILCGALATQKHLNDWGYLDPAESHDGEAAQALLELGAAARPCLTTLLDARTPVTLFGGEEATMSSDYRYRRADFAHRYLTRILGETPAFDPDPARRDEAIDALKRRLVQGR